MYRDVNPSYGVFEWWKAEDWKVLKVDFNAYVCETMAFPYDMEKDRVQHWAPLLVRHKDMTGGKAIRELADRIRRLADKED